MEYVIFILLGTVIFLIGLVIHLTIQFYEYQDRYYTYHIKYIELKSAFRKILEEEDKK